MSAHLDSIERQTGRRPVLRGSEAQDSDLPCPELVQYLFEWFLELSAQRSSNGFGANPLTFAECAAWATLTGREPSPWEVALLMRLDAVQLSALRPEA